MEGKNFVQIGEVIVGSSKSSLNNCSKLAKKLIEDKVIKSYLEGFQIKKVTGTSFG